MPRWDEAVFGSIDDYFPAEAAAEKAAPSTRDDGPPPPNGPEDYGTSDPPHHGALPGTAPEAFERKGPRFRLRPFNDITVGSELVYLVKGIIPRTGLVVVWGPPKCGKSFWTFHMVMHVALGWKYRGRRVQQGAVVYLALEGGKGFEARIEAFRQRHLPEHHDQVPFFLIADALNLVKDHSELIWLHSAASSRKCAGRSGH